MNFPGRVGARTKPAIVCQERVRLEAWGVGDVFEEVWVLGLRALFLKVPGNCLGHVSQCVFHSHLHLLSKSDLQWLWASKVLRWLEELFKSKLSQSKPQRFWLNGSQVGIWAPYLPRWFYGQESTVGQLHFNKLPGDSEAHYFSIIAALRLSGAQVKQHSPE